MIYTRDEFVDILNGMSTHHLGDDDSPAWVLEQFKNIKCGWFVKIAPRKETDKEKFWDWCHSTLTGSTLCYYVSDVDEWWGFTHYDDIVIWLLRWQGN